MSLLAQKAAVPTSQTVTKPVLNLKLSIIPYSPLRTLSNRPQPKNFIHNNFFLFDKVSVLSTNFLRYFLAVIPPLMSARQAKVKKKGGKK